MAMAGDESAVRQSAIDAPKTAKQSSSIDVPEPWMQLALDAREGTSLATVATAGSQSLLKPPAWLNPPWRMLLFGDGSPTKLLHLLTGSATVVELIRTTALHAGDDDNAPSEITTISGPRVRREVFLKNSRGETLGYASSWWCRTDYDKHLADKSLPIWKSLAARRTEVYREILDVYSGTSKPICAAFGVDHGTQLWGRHYLFWHQGKPMTMIYEVFNPNLSQWLGPCEATSFEIEDASSEAPVPESGAASGSG